MRYVHEEVPRCLEEHLFTLGDADGCCGGLQAVDGIASRPAFASGLGARLLYELRHEHIQ